MRAADEGVESRRRGKDASSLAISLVNGAAYRLAVGDLTGGREWAREAMILARRERLELLTAVSIQHLAMVAGINGDGRRGAELMGYVDACCSDVGYKRESTEQWSDGKLLASLRDTLSEDDIARLSAEGANWSEDRAVEEAMRV